MRGARALAAEAAGTFAVVGAACLAMVAGLGPLPNALLCGGVVALAILAFAGASGAHFNPAVTLALAAAGRFPWRRVAAYLAVQLASGLAAALAVRWWAGGDAAAAVKAASGPALAVAGVEAATTLALVATILAAVAWRWPRPWAALAIGGAVALGVALGWPAGAGGMNPARALGPAVASGIWAGLPLFLAVPLGAGLAAGAGSRALRRRPAAAVAEAA